MLFWFVDQRKKWRAAGGQGSEVLSISFPTEKPSAFVGLDDRVLTFNGSWPDVEALRTFKPWNKRPVVDGVTVGDYIKIASLREWSDMQSENDRLKDRIRTLEGVLVTIRDYPTIETDMTPEQLVAGMVGQAEYGLEVDPAADDEYSLEHEHGEVE